MPIGVGNLIVVCLNECSHRLPIGFADKCLRHDLTVAFVEVCQGLRLSVETSTDGRVMRSTDDVPSV